MSRKRQKRKKPNRAARMGRMAARAIIGTILEGRNSQERLPNGECGFEISHQKPTPERLALLHQGRMIDLILKGSHNWEVTAFAESLPPGADRIQVDAEEFVARGVQVNDLTPLVDPAIRRVKGIPNHKHLKDWGWRAVLLPPGKTSPTSRGEEAGDSTIISLELNR